MESIRTKKIDLTLDIIIVFIIISIPFLFFTYNIVPKNIQSIEIFGLELSSIFHKDLNYSFWIISNKFLIIIYCFLWFMSCQHNWKYFIVFPMLIEFVRIIQHIREDWLIELLFKPKIYMSIVVLSILIFLIIYFLYKQQKEVIHFFRNLSFFDDRVIDRLGLIKFEQYDLIIKYHKKIRKIKRGDNEQDYLKELIKLKILIDEMLCKK